MLTIREIAHLAKVSPSTVSRALYKPSLVKKETRDRILQITKKKNYVLNEMARGLATRKSNIIGLLIPTITHSIFALSTQGIQDYAEEKGYQIIYGNTNYELEKELRLINIFQQRRVDGLILTGLPKEKKPIMDFKQTGFPFVVTWEIVNDEAINMVAFNNFKSAYEATELLIKLGHRRIAMIPGVFSASERAFRRWKGYKKCLKDYGIEYDADLVIQKMYSFYDGKEAMTSLLKKQPSAVFCGTDVTAIGALRAIHDAGLKAPDDISVIGYDDSEYATFAYPPLTTVRIPAYEMGRLAAKVLMEIIQDKTERPQRYVLDTDLIIRDSSGPAKGSLIKR
jgi:DNA-binding LacI/PurR family transcriptional regulator